MGTTIDSYTKKAVTYATMALGRDPGSDQAWFVLGDAEHALKNEEKNEEKAVEAFDRVSPYSEYSVDALNAAASIYFEYLKDDRAAYLRFARAAQLALDNLSVLSNYAEFLLASGRDAQAKLAATRARDHAEAKAYIRAAMSFTMFAAELLSGERDDALAKLDEIERHVNAAAVDAKEAKARGQPPDQWSYKGIRRSLEQRLSADSPEQRTALLAVLTFVETDGHAGTLDDMRRLLGSQPAKEIMPHQ